MPLGIIAAADPLQTFRISPLRNEEAGILARVPHLFKVANFNSPCTVHSGLQAQRCGFLRKKSGRIQYMPNKVQVIQVRAEGISKVEFLQYLLLMIT